VVPSADASCITVKFLTNKNVKSQFGDETLSRNQVYDCSKSFKAEQRLETCEDYTFCKERYGKGFLRTPDHQRSLLFEAPYGPSKASLSFKTTRCGVVKSVCLLHDNASALRRCDNRKCIGRYCHTPPIVLTWCHAIFACSGHSKRP